MLVDVDLITFAFLLVGAALIRSSTYKHFSISRTISGHFSLQLSNRCCITPPKRDAKMWGRRVLWWTSAFQLFCCSGPAANEILVHYGPLPWCRLVGRLAVSPVTTIGWKRARTKTLHNLFWRGGSGFKHSFKDGAPEYVLADAS